MKDEEVINVFIDLDDTFIRYVNGEEAKEEDVIYILGGNLKLAHGAREFLLALKSIPNLHINIYSYGNYRRNLALTNYVIDSTELIINKLRVISPNPRLSPAVPKTKKLKLSEGDVKQYLLIHEIEGEETISINQPLSIDLENSILIDDRVDFVHAGEETSYVRVYTCDQSEAGKFIRDNNLVRVLGMILLAIRLSSEHGCSLVTALTAIQWNEQGGFRHVGVNDMGMYKLGLEEMRKFNPQMELKGNPGPGFDGFLAELEETRYFSRDLAIFCSKDTAAKLSSRLKP